VRIVVDDRQRALGDAVEFVAPVDHTGGLIGGEVAGDAHLEFIGALLILDGDVQNVVGDGGEQPCPHRVVLLLPERIVRTSEGAVDVVQDLELAASSPEVGGPVRIVTDLEDEGDRRMILDVGNGEGVGNKGGESGSYGVARHGAGRTLARGGRGAGGSSRFGRHGNKQRRPAAL